MGGRPASHARAPRSCIPVITGQDGIHVAFSSILDMDAFSLRIDTKDISSIPKLLKAVSKERIKTMQTNLARVWRRCACVCARTRD